MFAARNLTFASGFNPLTLAPAFWLSDTGSSAGTWPDISGNGRDFVQGTGVFQPAIVTNAINGRQIRRFDGSNDRMTNPTRSLLRNKTGATLITVIKPNTVAVNERAFFSYFSNGGANLFYGR